MDACFACQAIRNQLNGCQFVGKKERKKERQDRTDRQTERQKEKSMDSFASVIGNTQAFHAHQFPVH